ncbi:MAG: Spx/MgsR family RNA polymerase-binding regulatory protein [Bacilli bacterium]|nr:Spx/MgsR family RNA polymerase-binding regulatory protein [Bacilli bacterium]
MIKILISPSCASCRKVKKWFENNHIPFEAVNIFSPALTAEDIKEAITKSENGTDDIISRRSKVFQERGLDFDEMTVSELIAFVLENPSVLKRPIIIDDHRLQVGYNAEEIRTFIPHARRLAATTCNQECPKWASCDNRIELKDAPN